MKNVRIIYIFLICIYGCINIRLDISNDDKAWFPYSTKKIYATREAVFLIRVDSGLEPKHLALVPPSDSNRGSGYYSSPKSIEDYYKNPDEACRGNLGEPYKIDVVGVVEVGTELIPYKVKRNAGLDVWFGNHTYDTRYARIISGQFYGIMVDIEDISWCMKEATDLNRYIRIK